MTETGFFVAGRCITSPQSIGGSVWARYKLYWPGQSIHEPGPLATDVGNVLRRLCPEQFEAQRYQKLPYRKYKLAVPLPQGWTLKLYFEGADLSLEFVPPSPAGGACRIECQ